MDLTALQKKQVVGTVSFEGKFDVDLAYVPKDEMARAYDRCKTTVYGRSQPKEEIDPDKLRVELAKSVVGWKGLTFGVAATIIPIVVPEEKKDEEVPCTEENKMVLLKQAYGFDLFVQNMSTELSALRQEAERKN